MLSYSKYNKTHVSVTMKLSDWEFLAHDLRLRARAMNEELRPALANKYARLADEIESFTINTINGGNNQ